MDLFLGPSQHKETKIQSNVRVTVSYAFSRHFLKVKVGRPKLEVDQSGSRGPRHIFQLGRRIFRRSKPAIFQNGSMKSSEPPLSFHALDARLFFRFWWGTCVFMVGSLDSEMIFGIENSNSFPVRISS